MAASQVTNNISIRRGLLQKVMKSLESKHDTSEPFKFSQSTNGSGINLKVKVVDSDAKKSKMFFSLLVQPMLDTNERSNKRYTVSSDGRKITFHLAGGNSFVIYTDTRFYLSVAVINVKCPIVHGRWYTLKGVDVTRSIGKDGKMYENINAIGIEQWQDGPTPTQMYDALFQTYDPLHSNIRPYDTNIFPVDNSMEQLDAIRTNTELTADQRKEEAKRFKGGVKERFQSAFEDKLVEIVSSLKDETLDIAEREKRRYTISLFDKSIVKQHVSGPQRYMVIPFSKKARDLAEEIDKTQIYDTLMTVHRVQWSDSLYCRDKDGNFIPEDKKDYESCPDRNMRIFKADLKAIYIDQHKVYTFNITVVHWHSLFLDAFGIQHLGIAENLLMPRIGETEMMIVGKPNTMQTYSMMNNNPNSDEMNFVVNPTGVYVDYNHFLTEVCVRVDFDTAHELFKYWLYRRFGVTDYENISMNGFTITDKTQREVFATEWPYYIRLENSGVFGEMNGNSLRIKNLMNFASQNQPLGVWKSDYTYFVFAASQVKENVQSIFKEHANVKNMTHLKEISQNMAQFCKTGSADFFEHLMGRPTETPEFQIYAVENEFLESIILQKYVIPPRNTENISYSQESQTTLTSSSSNFFECIGRSASDLLCDDNQNDLSELLSTETSQPTQELEITSLPMTSSSSSSKRDIESSTTIATKSKRARRL